MPDQLSIFNDLVPDPAIIHCFYCKEVATKLCDGRFQGESCDRPLCDDHAHRAGIMFFCSRKKGVGGMDTVDYCHRCKTRQHLLKRQK